MSYTVWPVLFVELAQIKMQTHTDDSGFQRSKKYDSYIPPSTSVRARILDESGAVEPIAVQQYTHAQPVTHVTAPPPTTHNTHVVPKDFSVLKIVKPKRTSQKSLFASIVQATVQVEKVTKKSVKAVQHTFEPPGTNAFRTRRQKIFARSSYAVGSASFVLMLGFGLYTLLSPTTTQPNSQKVLGARTSPQTDANRVSEVPSENKPTEQDMQTYLVAAQYPRYIRIPSISVSARIRRLGLDSKGAVGSPNNIYDAGWYDGSVRPGEKDGSSIIIGHVAGATQHGIFWDISKLSIGQIIEIEKGSGEVVHYKVSKLDKLPAGDIDMSRYVKSETAGKHDLKLITSSGKYDELGGQYSGRAVVTAIQY